MEFFIGMMVIGIIAGVFVMTLLFHSDSGFFVGGSRGTRMSIEFKNGAGINQNSLVLKNGIRIGRVFSVVLIDDPGNSHVEVTFELEPEAKIYSNEVAKINRTFLGDASIEIVDNPDYEEGVSPEPELLGAGARLESLKTTDIVGTVTNLEGDLGKALQNVNQATEGVTMFMKNLNDFIGDEDELQKKKERLQTVFTELTDTLVSIRGLAENIDEVVSDEQLKASILETTSKIPSIVARVDEIAGKANILMENANAMSTDVRTTLSRASTTFDLVDKNLDNVGQFTTALADNGPEIMTSLNASAAEIKGAIDDVKGAIENIAQLANSLNEQMENQDTPLGLLTDKETAAELRRIVANAEELTEKLYPILDDARVFSNKIAHKPSSLIWDKTQSKGGSLSERFGWQTKSPTGGVSSPLYRQSPSGAKISDRYYYEPSADVNFMDSQTRAVYENELTNRAVNERLRSENEYAQSYMNGGYSGPDYSGVVPETNGYAPKKAFGSRIKERTSRVRWSLDSFWSKFSPKKSDDVELVQFDGVNMVGYNAYPELLNSVDQAAYLQAGFNGNYNGNYILADGIQANYYHNGFDGSCNPPSCGVPTCDVPPTCDAPGCDVPPTCDAPGCDVPPTCDAPGCDAPSSCDGTCPTSPGNADNGAGSYGGRTTGSGYQPQSVGAYKSKEPRQMEFSLSKSGEQVEELPSSINRSASDAKDNSSNMAGSAFEDDGLPLQFVPATQY
jgi:phospholipid/cholesterol/gamma-HCH transport system substrate-binding protein